MKKFHAFSQLIGSRSWGSAQVLRGKSFHRIFSAAVLTVLVGAAAQAQSWDTSTTPNPEKEKTQLKFADDPKSTVKGSSYRYGTEIDDFMGVTGWSSVDYNNWFFFLGGMTETRALSQSNTNTDRERNTGFQGGLAKKLGANHLGVYYNGNFFSGNGTNDGASPERKTDTGANWNNSLSILFGNEGIGGIRFNVLFNDMTFQNVYEYDGNKEHNNRDPTVTSIQWGKKLGDITPKVTIGFRWPDYHLVDSGSKTETWKSAQLGVKLEVGYKDFAADYQLTADFGTTVKSDAADTYASGFGDHNINFYYSKTLKVDEKLEFKVRPQLNFHIYHTPSEYDNGTTTTKFYPWGYFYFDPRVELGVKYAFTPKMVLYSGIKANIVQFTSWLTTSGDNDNTPSAWRVDGIKVETGNIALQLKPSDKLLVDFSLNGLITFTSKEVKKPSGGWNLSFSDLGGGLAVTIKP